MSAPVNKGWVTAQRLQTIMLPVTAISMVFVMLIPIPGFVLDMLLAISITASVIVFLTAVQVRRAVDFSVFPTLLLVAYTLSAFVESGIEPTDFAAWSRRNTRSRAV